MKLFKVYFDCSCILLQCEDESGVIGVLNAWDESFNLEDDGTISCDGEPIHEIKEVTSCVPEVLLAEIH